MKDGRGAPPRAGRTRIARRNQPGGAPGPGDPAAPPDGRVAMREAWGAAWREAMSAARRFVRFLALIAFLCALASFAQSSAFDIRAIDVAGNEAVATPDILAVSGLRTQTSVFTVNAIRVREHLRQDARIADASVAVVLPNRVWITVHEQPAAAALRLPTGYALVSADCVVLGAAKTPSGLPVLTVDRLDPAAPEPGLVVPSADARLGAEVAGSLPPALRPDVTALRVDRAGEVTLYVRDGIAVKAGGADGLRDRLARASDVLSAVRSRGLRVEYVDLRFPDSIIVKPVAPPGSSRRPHGLARPAGGGRPA
ncbi:MAG TPA: FtsQ-type POTRA domain-containing protein [bacterium]|nr:FtsQ-type POTRA domain-containing protein [bacterium]